MTFESFFEIEDGDDKVKCIYCTSISKGRGMVETRKQTRKGRVLETSSPSHFDSRVLIENSWWVSQGCGS